MEIDIWSILWNMLIMLFDVLKSIFYPLLLLLFLILLSMLYYYIYFRLVKKMKKVKPYYGRYYERNIFAKIFFDFPKQLVYDRLTSNPYDFKEFGIHMVCGKQGSGKTITAVYLLQKWKKMYPDLQVYSNSDLNFEDGNLTHWKQLLTRNNGTKGVVNFIDEIQTWFANYESKDLPPEVLGEISQQRKQRKAILGTAQVFGRIAKPLREQTHYVYRPHTFLGCITIVFTADANSYDSEHDRFKKKKSSFFIFVHNKELRNAYDTYKRISRYKSTKFSSSRISGGLSNGVEEPSSD